MANNSPFIDKQTAYDAFEESRKWMRPYFDPIDELERLARNRPSPNIDPALPKITDGTLASIIQETPKRVIQQLSTGKVSCQDYPEYAAVADIVLTERLLPLYNRMGSALQKDWNMLSKSMTYGLGTSYTFFTSTAGQMHTDFVIPYVKDVIIEKGKVFAPDSNVAFMRSWYQKRDLKAIINKEKALMDADKTYKSGWDLGMLAEFMEVGASAKTADLQTPAEREKSTDTGGFEIIHAFQVGKGAEFYSFAPRYKEGQAIRTKINNDPRGFLPLDFLYCNIDLSSPLGRGMVELSGGIQNLMDQKMQMNQFLMTLLMGPPLKKWGNVNKKSLKFLPNAIWDMGSNKQTSDVEPYQVSNIAIQQFIGDMQFLQSKIYNINSAQDNSIPAKDNNVGQSKTPQGVAASQQRLGVADNYLRKQFEDWDSDQRETSLNIFFAEMQGNDTIELGEQQIRELLTTRAAKFVDQKKNIVKINYGDMKDVTFKFQSDPGSSKTADDLDQMQRLQEAIKEATENGPVVNWYLGQMGKKLNVGEMYVQLFKRMGLENLDTIVGEMDAKEKQAASQAPFPIMDKPQIRLSGTIPTAAMPAALGAGGVSVDPNSVKANPMEQLDVGDILKDPSTTVYEKAQIKQMAGVNPDPMALQAAHAEAQNPTPQPTEADLKAQDLNIKKQNADTQATKTALEVSNTAHSHAMDIHREAMTAATPQQPENEATDNPAEEQGESPATAQAEAQPQQQPQSQTPPALTDALSPQEQQVATELLQRGFDEADVEQAIVMLRQGVPVAQVITVLGQKHASTVGR